MTSLSVTTEALDDDSVDLFGKVASDLQEDIVVGTSAIAGTLKYVADYSSAFGGDLAHGNYIALVFSTPGVSGATLVAEVVNGTNGPATLDADGILVAHITDKSSQKIKIVASKEGYETVTKTYSLNGLTLSEAPAAGEG